MQNKQINKDAWVKKCKICTYRPHFQHTASIKSVRWTQRLHNCLYRNCERRKKMKTVKGGAGSKPAPCTVWAADASSRSLNKMGEYVKCQINFSANSRTSGRSLAARRVWYLSASLLSQRGSPAHIHGCWKMLRMMKVVKFKRNSPRNGF